MILVIGANGYVGSRLIPRLLAGGARVRAASRDPASVRRPWRDDVELVSLDLEDAVSIRRAVRGCRTVYYLAHGMEGGSFAEREARCAQHFLAAAKGVRRVVYLGGLGSQSAASEHLRSRHAVERILRAHPGCVALRAAMVLGQGSASFEILRSLIERLPIMIAPSWLETPTEPIGIADLLRYLVRAPRLAPGSYDVGCGVQLSYSALIALAGRAAGRRRAVLTVPLPFPGLSALWIRLVTPVPGALVAPLVASLQYPMVVEHRIPRPGRCASPEEALRAAFAGEARLPGDPSWVRGSSTDS